MTTLVIPELNDSIEEIEELAKWLHLFHLKSFCTCQDIFQGIRWIKPATPLKTLSTAGEKASKYLKHVYFGNV